MRTTIRQVVLARDTGSFSPGKGPRPGKGGMKISYILGRYDHPQAGEDPLPTDAAKAKLVYVSGGFDSFARHMRPLHSWLQEGEGNAAWVGINGKWAWFVTYPDEDAWLHWGITPCNESDSMSDPKDNSSEHAITQAIKVLLGP